MELIPGIRNGVRAVIIRNDHLLLLRKEYDDGLLRYVLPGGSQDLGETLEDALKRECREEIGAEVELCELIYLADFFKPRGTEPQTFRQQVEYFFTCTLSDSYETRNGHRPDRHQVGVEWQPVRQLADINLFPSSLVSLLSNHESSTQKIYQGEIRA
ncbi:MAG: NUDIX domain-containing protein [Gammaproteobacteria bacterium]|nr:NUDIX domain-containing protein [Gammaproteobacteria bacterium]